ncbi:MAG: hypothetical protein OXG23_14755 [Chloroflexi bacterium]|nr:hypothetical protein [Chloroflexota bacterium]
MKSSAFELLCVLLPIVLITACGTMAPAPKQDLPRPGVWSQQYTGECAGRESEKLLITQLNEEAIVFDEFELLRNEAGEYVGSAIFIAPMPVDGRDIPYEITYALKANDDGGFSGTETIVEGGGHGIACPIELVYLGAEQS